MKRQVYLQCCAIVAIALAIAGAATAASPKFITLGVTEQINHDQSVSYSLYTQFLSPFTRSESIIGPTGQVFGPFPGTQLRLSSWEDLTENLIGNWTFTSTSKGNPTDVEQYRFTISPFQYEGLTPTTPTISPVNHSFVSSPFTVTWDPPSNNYGYGAGGIANVVGRLIEPGKMEISFGKTLNPGAYLSFGQGSLGQSLNEYVSITDGPASDPEYDLTLSMDFSRQVDFRYYPVGVPEPSGLVLTILGGLVIRSGRPARPSNAAHQRVPR